MTEMVIRVRYRLRIPKMKPNNILWTWTSSHLFLWRLNYPQRFIYPVTPYFISYLGTIKIFVPAGIHTDSPLLGRGSRPPSFQNMENIGRQSTPPPSSILKNAAEKSPRGAAFRSAIFLFPVYNTVKLDITNHGITNSCRNLDKTNEFKSIDYSSPIYL